MKHLHKILLSLLVMLILSGIAGYAYLFVDTAAYPSVSTQGLHRIASASIPEGKSVIHVDSISKNILVAGEWFKDPAGRVMDLRGINLGGNCKLPFTPRIASHVSLNN